MKYFYIEFWTKNDLEERFNKIEYEFEVLSCTSPNKGVMGILVCKIKEK